MKFSLYYIIILYIYFNYYFIIIYHDFLLIYIVISIHALYNHILKVWIVVKKKKKYV